MPLGNADFSMGNLVSDHGTVGSHRTNGNLKPFQLGCEGYGLKNTGNLDGNNETEFFKYASMGNQ